MKAKALRLELAKYVLRSPRRPVWPEGKERREEWWEMVSREA